MSLSTLRFPVTVRDGVRGALLACVAGLLYYAYGVQNVEAPGMSCYQWLTGHWRNVSNYTHGPLIPLIAIGLVAMKRRELALVNLKPLDWGAAVVAVAMVVYYFGVKAIQPRLVVFSFVVLLYGLVLALAGRGAFRALFFPITFLMLMIPLNFLKVKLCGCSYSTNCGGKLSLALPFTILKPQPVTHIFLKRLLGKPLTISTGLGNC